MCGTLCQSPTLIVLPFWGIEEGGNASLPPRVCQVGVGNHLEHPPLPRGWQNQFWCFNLRSAFILFCVNVFPFLVVPNCAG